MDKAAKANIFGAIAGGVGFAVFYLGFEWPIWLSLIFAVALFFAIYLITQPVHKIGDIEIDQLKNGEELQQIYQEAQESLERTQRFEEGIRNEFIQQKAQDLQIIGQDILRYLANHPKQISTSRHFLDYYLPTAEKIVGNYYQLEEANVSASKMEAIQEQTSESLDLLTKIYARQRDSYHTDTMLALEVETELLEKTIELGGEEL